MPVKKQHNQNAELGTQNSSFNVVKTRDTRPFEMWKRNISKVHRTNRRSVGPETARRLTCGL